METKKEELRSELKFIATYLQADLKASLLKKGHNATGNLDKSVEVAVLDEMGGFNIQGRYLFYGEYVDRGRPAGLKKVPLDDLIAWIRAKKLKVSGTDKEIEGLAYAIQNKIFKKGIKAKRWQSQTLEVDENRIATDIEKAVNNILFLIIENMIEQTQKLITND